MKIRHVIILKNRLFIYRKVGDWVGVKEKTYQWKGNVVKKEVFLQKYWCCFLLFLKMKLNSSPLFPFLSSLSHLHYHLCKTCRNSHNNSPCLQLSLNYSSSVDSYIMLEHVYLTGYQNWKLEIRLDKLQEMRLWSFGR